MHLLSLIVWLIVWIYKLARNGGTDDPWPGFEAWISRPLPELRRRPPVPRLREGRRPLRQVRRGLPPSPRRRLPGLSGDRAGRAHRGAARAVGRDRLQPALLGPCRAVGAADRRPRARAPAADQGRGRRAAVARRHARLR